MEEEKRVKIPIGKYFKACGNETLSSEIAKCKKKCFAYNSLDPTDTKSAEKILSSLLGKMGKNTVICQPFQCDYGYNIFTGDNFYSNHNLIINDGASVTFGNDVFVAPNCCFTTAEHAIDPEMRKAGIEVARPIKIGNNVWIGAGCTVLCGVEIGDNTVIGAGSVVTKSIPANSVAVGVPCRVIRKITEDDKFKYPMYEGDDEFSPDAP